jgi:hypothetical protein
MKLKTVTPKQQTKVCLYHKNLLFIINISEEPSPSPHLLSFLHKNKTHKASNKTKCNDPQNPLMKMDSRRKSIFEPGACIMEDELETMAATPCSVDSKNISMISESLQGLQIHRRREIKKKERKGPAKTGVSYNGRL